MSKEHRIIVDSWFSRALQRTKSLNIVLPLRSSQVKQRYPVLVLLHGYGGNRNTWLSQTDLLTHAVPHELIIVLPESGRRWFINDHQYNRYEDYLIDEVVPYIDEHFDTLGDRTGRAIAGFSMGGAAAVFQALRHPEVFSVAASHSGAFEAPLRQGDPYAALRKHRSLLMPTVEFHERVWGPEGSETRWRYDPYRLLRLSGPRSRPALYLDVGAQDYERMVGMNRNFHHALAEAGTDHEYFEYPGSHDWAYVNGALPSLLHFVRQRLGARSSYHSADGSEVTHGGKGTVLGYTPSAEVSIHPPKEEECTT